jgi:hypothetical protein
MILSAKVTRVFSPHHFVGASRVKTLAVPVDKPIHCRPSPRGVSKLEEQPFQEIEEGWSFELLLMR